MVCVPAPELGVYVTEQLLGPLPEPESVHVAAAENAPVPLLVNVTVPDGADAVPLSVSLTVAVQVVAWLTTTLAGAQLTAVLVIRFVISTLTVDVLAVVASSEVTLAVLLTVAALVVVAAYVTVMVALAPPARCARLQLIDWLAGPHVKPPPVIDVTFSRESTVSVTTRLSASETPLFVTAI